MVVQTKYESVEAFDEFAQLPENADKLLEYIAGEVYEVPSNPLSSMIAGLILTAINLYLRSNPIGYVTGEAGGYMVSGQRFAPDVAFISYEKQAELPSQGYNPNPPDLAVEVISDPNNREEQNKLRLKITSYLAAGVLVWVVNPGARTVEVHQVGQAGQLLDDEKAVLEGGDILPGFELPLSEIFPARRES